MLKKRSKGGVAAHSAAASTCLENLPRPAVLAEMRNAVPLIPDQHRVSAFVRNQRRKAKIQLDEITSLDGQPPYLAHAVARGPIAAAAIIDDVLTQVGQVPRTLCIRGSRQRSGQSDQ